jgi:hypothetical protein
VRFTDLLSDWRTTMHQVQEQLGITFNTDLSAQEPHEVDDFIDVDLRRNRVDWEDVDTIPELRDLAELAWEACNAMVDAPYDDKAVRALEEVHERYVVLHQYAEAIAMDHTNVCVVRETREVRQRMRAKQQGLRQRLVHRRRQIEQLREQAARPAARRRFRLPWKR